MVGEGRCAVSFCDFAQGGGYGDGAACVSRSREGREVFAGAVLALVSWVSDEGDCGVETYAAAIRIGLCLSCGTP